MFEQKTQAAIDAALAQNWQRAVDLNTEILKDDPTDLDCLNRLGRAYLELGNNKKAATYFKEVLKVNKYDPIATKNLLRANETSAPKTKQKGKTDETPNRPQSPTISFLEEPGKTKMITLVNVAPAKVLLTLQCTDHVSLTAKRHTIFAERADGVYLGALPDDLGHRILVLIKGGNEYEAFVRSVGKGSLVLFIRERVRSKKFKNTPSFPSGSTDYLSFVRDDNHVDDTEKEATDEDSGDDEDEASFKKAEKLHQDEMPEEN